MDKIYKQIDDFSREFGVKDGQRAIFEMTCDGENRNLSLKSGSFEADEPWFIIDEERDLKAMVSIKSLLGLVRAYKSVQKQLFEMRLEKSIWQNVPVDFSDVWAVAMDEVEKNSDGSINQNSDMNLDKLIKDIKKEHPNLFVNMEEIIKNAKTKGKNYD